ncbi:MAG: hypothetical protein QCI82_06480 [Candidatus Thermoplasmatota archaeon]|nr:hypothetical protein [Candidatus Thermoplasmatota archaeon]
MPPQKARLLDCPGCNKQLEDTRQDKMTCKYCGYTFNRDDVVQEDEDYIRRKMVVDLRSQMDKYKARKKFSTIFMAVFFALALPLLFFKDKDLTMTITLLVLYMLTGFAFFIFMIFNDRLYDSTRSKASDLSVRRRI